MYRPNPEFTPEQPVVSPLTEQEQRRARLVHLLRHREEWPKGFEWDYTECSQCAIGLMCNVGMLSNRPLTYSDFIWAESETEGVAAYLGLTGKQAYQIFWRANGGEHAPNAASPERVADLIEHLAPVGVRS